MSELKDYDIMDIEAMDDERLEKSESGKSKRHEFISSPKPTG